MITLLKNLDCFCPRHVGKKDILITADKIYRILPAGTISENSLIENDLDCSGLLAFPGLIDQHVHITGAGGEQGFISRLPEITPAEIFGAGVTTIVGLLGADGCTRSLENLYAKAKSLEQNGVTTYVYSGSYSVPTPTFTGSIVKDMVLIDKVIGAGEIAVSDHRSSNPTADELLKLAADVHLGGLLGEKAGVMHIHVGDGSGGLKPVWDMINGSELPVSMFVPTHLNRNAALLKQAAEYCRFGGNADLTAGETAGTPVGRAVEYLSAEGTDLSRVTVSSDANGSIPGGGVSKIGSLYEDIKSLAQSAAGPETAFRMACENVAKILRIYPAKGVLMEGSDADIIITDSEYSIRMLFCMGKLVYKTC